jgi:protein-S-isoprenylcysteine O-methyltransferase Ste14
MSRMRKLVGLWIAVVVYIGSSVAYYFVVRWMDDALGLPTLMSAQISALFAAVSLFAGLYWASWGYSYLHFVGKGSPVEAFGRALDPTQCLVTTGPYAYTRNPMLIGFLFLMLAGALYADSISGVVLIPVLALVALLYIRRFEEPALVRRFGKCYEDYREAVPALIPSIRPHIQ